MKSTLETRTAVLDRISEREIVIRVAPYDETAELPGGIKERYTRGAFGIPAGSISLKLETAPGHSGPVVGVSTGWEDRTDGLFGTFKIAETRDGDDALALADLGALGASAGFLLDPKNVTRSKSDGAMEIGSADLREVTLTATPAYQSAGPVEIRSTNEGNRTMDPATETTTIPEPSVDVDSMIAAAVEKAVDETRSAILATSSELPVVEAEHRGHEYRSVGEVLADMNLHARGKSPEASERLTRSIDAGLVESDGSELHIRDAFGPPVPTSVGNSVPNETYIPELLTLLREGRPVADLFNGRDLPSEGNTIQLPEISVGNSVGYQDAQGDEVDRTDQVQILTDFEKATIAGGQPMSIQAQMWSNPSYFASVVEDLAAAYSEFLDGRTINGDPVVDTPASGTGFSGILDAGATDVPVGGDHAAAVALVGTAWAAVYAGSRRSPIAAMMNSADWGAFLDEVDTDGRPLVTTDFPANPVGVGNAATISGTLRSLPVVLDDNIVAGNVILGSFRDALLFEDSASPAQIALTFPSTLVTDVTIYGFASLAIRRPASFAVLSGIA